MKLKYYFRGFGAGMIATSVMLSIAGSVNANNEKYNVETHPTTTSSIITYTTGDSSSLSENDSKESESKEGSTAEKTSTTEVTTRTTESSTTTKATTQATTTTEASTTTAAATTTAAPTTEATTEATRPSVVTIHIINVYKASQASDILFDAGVITDKAGFTDYLFRSGYDQLIVEGYYDVTPGESFESIAKKICRR